MKGGYTHPMFQRFGPLLCSEMERQKREGVAVNSIQSSNAEVCSDSDSLSWSPEPIPFDHHGTPSPMTLESCIDHLVKSTESESTEALRKRNELSSALPPIISFDNLLDITMPPIVMRESIDLRGAEESNNVLGLLHRQSSPFDTLVDPICHDLDEIFAS